MWTTAQDLSFPPHLQSLVHQANCVCMQLSSLITCSSSDCLDPFLKKICRACLPLAHTFLHPWGSLPLASVWLKFLLPSTLTQKSFGQSGLTWLPILNVSLYSYPGYPLLFLISFCCISYFQTFYKINFLCCYYCLPPLKCSPKRARVLISLAH